MKKFLVVVVSVFLMLSACSSDEKTFDLDHEINLVSREDGSGTRGAFTDLVGISRKDEAGDIWDDTSLEAIITNSTSVVLTSVSGDVHAIGYLSLGSMNSMVKAVPINNSLPTTLEIKSGNYPIVRPFLVATLESQSQLSDDFIEFLYSDIGQETIANMGFVPTSNQNTTYVINEQIGKIVVGGSSSVTPVMEKLKEAYIDIYPEVSIEIQQSDSTTGMASVLSGNYDIGMSSRELKDSEKNSGLNSQVFALDGIVLVINHSNPLETLELDQVRDIFTGKFKTWKDVR